MTSHKKTSPGEYSQAPWSAADIIYASVLSIIFIISIVAVIIMFSWASSNMPASIEKGPFGDYIAGVLNPILTFLTLFGVLISIFLQRRELSLTRAELERSADALENQISSIELQNFEATFFQMLNTFNSIVASVDLIRPETGDKTTGRDCFKVFYTRLSRCFRENSKKSQGKYKAESVLRLSYFQFWKSHSLELGHYYRTLFSIFRFLDENPLSKPYHAKLLRAQLSDQELLLLFYNCLSKEGRKFEKYAIKYELFDNLPTYRLLETGHLSQIDSRSFGNNPMYTPKNMRDSF